MGLLRRILGKTKSLSASRDVRDVSAIIAHPVFRGLCTGPMTVFGYIRFSYFGRNDTKLGRASIGEDERFDRLYNPRRMNHRFHLFEKLTLPSLRMQTDQAFRVVVLASTVMPEVYKTRLECAVADVPQVEVLYSDAAHVTDALNPRLEELTRGLMHRTAHFRMDDDDALSARYVTLLKRTTQHARENEFMTFPRGLYLTVHDGTPILARKFEPYIAIGWAFANAPRQIRNPYQGAHGAHHLREPSFMDPRAFAYIHTSHVHADTSAGAGRKLQAALKQDPDHDSPRGRAVIDRILERWFPAFTRQRLEEIILHPAE